MSIEFRDYYETLGLKKNSTADEIKKAFRRLARKFHPDVAKDKKGAEERFKQINEAYEVLSDPVKRQKYDQLGANWDKAPRGGARGGYGGGQDYEYHFGGTGFSDFFEQFFGAQGRQGGSSRSGSPFDDLAGNSRRGAFQQKGHDLESDILVTLNEVLSGTLRSVSLQQTDPRTGEAKNHTFRVKIPAGVGPGQRIRVAGKGGQGIGGGQNGDLILRVKYARHPDFQPKGADLLASLRVAPWEAVLGATVKVPTLEGGGVASRSSWCSCGIDLAGTIPGFAEILGRKGRSARITFCGRSRFGW
jgi:curved DNA-binding protein